MQEAQPPHPDPLADPLAGGAGAAAAVGGAARGRRPAEVELAVPARQVAVAVLVLMVLGDVFFYGRAAGASVGLYALAVAVAVGTSRGKAVRGWGWRWRWGGSVFGVLLGASCLQAAVETSFSNGAVLTVLVLVLAGQSFYRGLEPGWGRWVEAALSALRPLSRWQGLAAAVREEREARGGPGFGEAVGFAARAAFPAALGLVLFGLLLGKGNAIMGDWLAGAWRGFSLWVAAVELPAPSRVALWAGAGTAALVVLLPVPGSSTATLWGRDIPAKGRPGDLRLALWRSWLLLGAVNVVFLFSNSIDVAYLWARMAPPEGVRLTAYVHHGVHLLSFTVALSAVVLVAVFRQHGSVAGSPALRGLALAWIGQNLFLVAGVFLRTRVYIESSVLTPKRVYVLFFLLLVAAGFVLLARFVLGQRGFKWLLLANAAAVFALFTTVQFLDVKAFVGRYNHPAALEEVFISEDPAYFEQLGPAAWPLLVDMVKSSPHAEIRDNARALLDRAVAREAGRTGRGEAWFEYQHRRWQARATLRAYWDSDAGQGFSDPSAPWQR